MVNASDLARVLKVTPKDWHGTTFANKDLLGREAFSDRLRAFLASGVEVTADSLASVGNAEDYLRVATNLSTLLEMALATAHLDGDVSRVFTFASGTMPVIAASLAAADGKNTAVTARVFAPSAANAARVSALTKYVAPLGVNLIVDSAPAAAGAGELKIRYGGGVPTKDDDGTYDAVVDPRGVLFIINKERVKPALVLVKRKRMATPLTTPVAEAWLSSLAAGGSGPESDAAGGCDASGTDDEAFLKHLREICGAPVDAPAVVCTAGLPTLASLWLSLSETGGVDILMCATAYGGSSQLADVLSARSDRIRKHIFPLTGAEDGVTFTKRVDAALAEPALKEGSGPIVVFLEAPSNPDMMVPDFDALAASLKNHTASLGRVIAVMVDTTLSPTSRVLERLAKLAPEVPALAFVSLSKSVSRGITTGGTIVSNDTPVARTMVTNAAEAARTLDTNARPDQWRALDENHTGVEDRVARAFKVASSVAEELASAVDLPRPISFVSASDAESGFTPSTFSFNLPADGTDVTPDQIAQRFVDLITEDRTVFKPCVSFGQDNGLVYATVPATSTQGAIRAEDKDKQAVGGVQLVRLSFAAGCDVDRVRAIVRGAVETMYGKKK
jgi:cystathionine beta-lyase/cystathionine gamma-synthase